MSATLIRGETPSAYNYHLIDNGKTYRLYRGKNYSHYIKVDGARVPIYFNEYLFPQYSEIPMKRGKDDSGDDCWGMEHEYRQTAGGASAPYERIGEEQTKLFKGGVHMSVREVLDLMENMEQLCDGCRFAPCEGDAPCIQGEIARLLGIFEYAKPPIIDGEFGQCPTCEREFNSELLSEYDITNCPYCGQRLKD